MENKRIPCPSCRAEIEVDARGDLAGGDVGHFSLHETPETPPEAPETPQEPQTPAPPADSPTEPAKVSWQDRLAQALED